MRIVRKEHVRCIYIYSIELNEDYVKEFNTYLKSRCLDEIPDITIQDIIDAIDYNDNENIKVEYKWRAGSESFYRDNLRDVIREVVNEDLWNSDYDEEYDSSDWYETYIEGE